MERSEKDQKKMIKEVQNTRIEIFYSICLNDESLVGKENLI
jgi:hypothetical protein